MTDKIIIDRALLEQALEALLDARSLLHDGRKQDRALTALRSALSEAALQRLTDIHQEMEQPQQSAKHGEPVAYVDGDEAYRRILWEPSQAAFDLAVGTKLYTHPAPRTEQRLTDTEIFDLWNNPDNQISQWKFARAIEASILGKQP